MLTESPKLVLSCLKRCENYNQRHSTMTLGQSSRLLHRDGSVLKLQKSHSNQLMEYHIRGFQPPAMVSMTDLPSHYAGTQSEQPPAVSAADLMTNVDARAPAPGAQQLGSTNQSGNPLSETAAAAVQVAAGADLTQADVTLQAAEATRQHAGSHPVKRANQATATAQSPASFKAGEVSDQAALSEQAKIGEGTAEAAGQISAAQSLPKAAERGVCIALGAAAGMQTQQAIHKPIFAQHGEPAQQGAEPTHAQQGADSALLQGVNQARAVDQPLKEADGDEQQAQDAVDERTTEPVSQAADSQQESGSARAGHFDQQLKTGQPPAMHQHSEPALPPEVPDESQSPEQLVGGPSQEAAAAGQSKSAQHVEAEPSTAAMAASMEPEEAAQQVKAAKHEASAKPRSVIPAAFMSAFSALSRLRGSNKAASPARAAAGAEEAAALATPTAEQLSSNSAVRGAPKDFTSDTAVGSTSKDQPPSLGIETATQSIRGASSTHEAANAGEASFSAPPDIQQPLLRTGQPGKAEQAHMGHIAETPADVPGVAAIASQPAFTAQQRLELAGLESTGDEGLSAAAVSQPELSADVSASTAAGANDDTEGGADVSVPGGDITKEDNIRTSAQRGKAGMHALGGSAEANCLTSAQLAAGEAPPQGQLEAGADVSADAPPEFTTPRAAKPLPRSGAASAEALGKSAGRQSAAAALEAQELQGRGHQGRSHLVTAASPQLEAGTPAHCGGAHPFHRTSPECVREMSLPTLSEFVARGSRHSPVLLWCDTTNARKYTWLLRLLCCWHPFAKSSVCETYCCEDGLAFHTKNESPF